MRRYNPKDFESAEAIAKHNKAFKVRTELMTVLVALLEKHPSTFVYTPAASSIQEVHAFEPMQVREAAQSLAFLVTVKDGWGPGTDEVEEMAEKLVTAFISFCEAYATEKWQNPQKAALSSIQELELSL